ncbi:hypothetical protein HF313_01600 [Massilia atriviolacea]|uniref:Uncharacterized protein n=1 Tax=Massilia atriviolacea TaxID=2495579 RepID=A0A430HNQ9_9BURK|nr:hypothetical protein [Massilia atriviolacea]RSZ59131.1 hypothetical protein EJB06_08000 [Massilia atriviolacea]
MVNLTFNTTDPEEILLAQRYWAMDGEGKYKENVAALLPFRGLTITAQLSAHMRTIVTATDPNQQCPKCGNFEVVTNRSHVKRKAGVMRFKCTACIEAERALSQAQRQQASNDLSKFLTTLGERRSRIRTEYANLPADIVLLLMALDQAINPRLAKGTFRESECAALVPGHVGHFIQKLRGAQVIVDHPSLTSSDAYEFQDGHLSYYPKKVVYKLVPDPVLSNEEVLGLLRNMELKDNAALRELWLDYAASECIAYLDNQCEYHGMSVGYDTREEFFSSVRLALQKYSVTKVWNVIWRVVREALVLAARSYSNKTKASATIPGKLRRHLEKVEKGEAKPLEDWERPNWQGAGTLGNLFTEIFSIDETTPGTEVMAMFPDPTFDEGELSIDAEPIRLAAHRLFTAAVAHDLAANALITLANGIKEGLELSDAINNVFDRHPGLNEPY